MGHDWEHFEEDELVPRNEGEMTRMRRWVCYGIEYLAIDYMKFAEFVKEPLGEVPSFYQKNIRNEGRLY